MSRRRRLRTGKCRAKKKKQAQHPLPASRSLPSCRRCIRTQPKIMSSQHFHVVLFSHVVCFFSSPLVSVSRCRLVPRIRNRVTTRLTVNKRMSHELKKVYCRASVSRFCSSRGGVDAEPSQIAAFCFKASRLAFLLCGACRWLLSVLRVALQSLCR